MHYRVHILDSQQNIAATVEFECDGDAAALARVGSICASCTLELWQEGKLMSRREAKFQHRAKREALASSFDSPGNTLADLDRRISEGERNLLLLRGDHERLLADGLPTDLVELLLENVQQSLKSMKDYRLLLLTAVFEMRQGFGGIADARPQEQRQNRDGPETSKLER